MDIPVQGIWKRVGKNQKKCKKFSKKCGFAKKWGKV